MRVRQSQHAGAADGKACDGADYGGVKKDPGHADQPLSYRAFRVGAGGGHGGGAKPRFVGKNTSGDPPADGASAGDRPQSAAQRRFRRKGAPKHQRQRVRQTGQISQNHRRTAADVQQRHHRHQQCGGVRNAADATQQDRQRQCRRCHPYLPAGQGKCGGAGVCQRAGLRHGAHGKGHQQGEECVELSQRISWPAQPCLHYRHGAAPAGAVGTDAAVLYRQHTLGKLDGQSQCRRQLHPHQRTRPAGYQCRCNAYDVASANRGGQRRHQGAEGGYAVDALAPGVPPQGQRQRLPQIPLRKPAGTQRQPRPGSQNQRQRSRPPEKCVQRFQHGAPPFRDSLCGNWPVKTAKSCKAI